MKVVGNKSTLVGIQLNYKENDEDWFGVFPVTDIEFISQNNQYLVIVKIATVPLYEQKKLNEDIEFLKESISIGNAKQLEICSNIKNKTKLKKCILGYPWKGTLKNTIVNFYKQNGSTSAVTIAEKSHFLNQIKDKQDFNVFLRNLSPNLATEIRKEFGKNIYKNALQNKQC